MSSFITLDELTLEMPGVATNPIDIGPTGISLSISMNSGALRQDVTSVNPLGGVGGLTKASTSDRGEDIGAGRVLNRQDGRAAGAVCESTRDLPFGLGMEVSGGISLVTCTGWEGCRIIPQLAYLDAASRARDASGMSVVSSISVTAAAAMTGWAPSSSGRSNPWKTSSSWNAR